MNRSYNLPQCILLLLAIAAALCAQPGVSAKMNVAVNDLQGKGVDDATASIISERLRSEMLNTGVFRVMERSEMEGILKEQGFQQTGACDESSCLVKVGQLLGVDRVVAGSVGQIGSLYTISLRMINVATGEILFTVSEDFEGTVKDLLSKATKSAANKLAAGAGGEIKNAALVGRTGDLYIVSQPQGAAIEIDGKAVAGETPVTLKGIAAGQHRIAARRGNYYGAQDVTIAPDDLVKVNLILEEGKGSLKLFSMPDAAEVMLDGKIVGVTPLKLDNIAVGEHELRVSKSLHIAVTSNVRINNNELNSLSIDLKPSAQVSVRCSQNDARILVNGVEAGRGAIAKLEVPAGKVSVQAELTGYEPFKETISLVQGETRMIFAELPSVFGALKVTSQPQGASVFLNEKRVGTAPYNNATLTPGRYRLVLTMGTYNDAAESITILKNQTVERTVILSHTSSYVDSMRIVGKRRHIRGQWTRRFLFGGLAVGAWGGGIYMNALAMAHVNNQKQIQANYRNETIVFDGYRQDYETEGKNAAEDIRSRNLWCAVAGVFTIGCLISIPF